MRTLPEPVREACQWLLVCGLAFFLADTASAALEQRWALPSEPLTPEVKTALPSSGATALPVPPELVKLLSTTEPPLSAVPTPSGGARTAAPGIEEAELSVTLIGSIAGVGGAGVAMLDMAGESLVLGPGQPLADWTVKAVLPTSVVLERKGTLQTLELNQPASLATDTKPANPPGKSSSQTIPPTAQPTPVTQAMPATAVEPITTKSELSQLLENGVDVAKWGSLKPVIREEEIIGYGMKVKNPAFPLARLGLLSGDIILSVNDVPANGPEKLAELYRTLKNTNSLSFEIERNGQKTIHKVELED